MRSSGGARSVVGRVSHRSSSGHRHHGSNNNAAAADDDFDRKVKSCVMVNNNMSEKQDHKAFDEHHRDGRNGFLAKIEDARDAQECASALPSTTYAMIKTRIRESISCPRGIIARRIQFAMMRIAWLVLLAIIMSQ